MVALSIHCHGISSIKLGKMTSPAQTHHTGTLCKYMTLAWFIQGFSIPPPPPKFNSSICCYSRYLNKNVPH